MIKPAVLYSREIEYNILNTWYDLRYQYYHGWVAANKPDIRSNTRDYHQFASVVNDEYIDGKERVIGYIEYQCDRTNNAARSLIIASFEIGNPTFIRDVLQVIDEVFTKFNFDKLTFTAYADSPVVDPYRRYLSKVGGREIGTSLRESTLMDGKKHDLIFFEIHKEDYLKSRKKGSEEKHG